MEPSSVVVLLIFTVTFVMILGPWVHRTTAALMGAMLMVIASIALRIFEEDDVFTFIKWDVIALLIGMMIIVGILNDIGFFEFIAVYVGSHYAASRWGLLLHLSAVTTFLSMLVDNVTTILIMVPVTVAISKEMRIDPKPILLAEAILSDVGGIGTMVGDPPNLIIAAYSGYSFNDFLVYLMPPVLISLLVSVLVLKVVLRRWSSGPVQRVEAADPWSKITDMRVVKQVAVVLVGCVVFFVADPVTGISPAFVALTGGAIALFLTRADPYRTLSGIEWPTILFFASLFVLVEGVVEVGLVRGAAEWMVSVSSGNDLLLVLIIFWFALIMSALIDNIPFTATMAPLILHMSLPGSHLALAWWALALGVGLGGNLTPVGSSANIVTLGLSEKLGHTISTRDWLRMSTPVAIVSALVAMGYLALLWFVTC